MRSINKSALYVILLIAICDCCSATSVFVILTPKGIAVGADFEAGTLHIGPDASPSVSTLNKLFLIRQRAIAGTVGIGETELSTLDDKPLFYYNADSFMRELEDRTARNASLSQIIDAVQDQSRIAFAPMDDLVQHKVIERNDCLGVQYLIAGYESGVPTVAEINFEFDWQNLRMRGPLVERVFPAPNARRNYFGYHAASHGYMFAASEAHRGEVESQGYKSVTAEARRELRMLLAHRDLSLNDATVLLHAFLRAEHKESPEAVGPPYILKTGGVKKILYRD